MPHSARWAGGPSPGGREAGKVEQFDDDEFWGVRALGHEVLESKELSTNAMLIDGERVLLIASHLDEKARRAAAQWAEVQILRA